jgi:hypothetical protein
MLSGKHTDSRQIVQVAIDPLQKPGTSACRLLGEAVIYGWDEWFQPFRLRIDA